MSDMIEITDERLAEPIQWACKELNLLLAALKAAGEKL